MKSLIDDVEIERLEDVRVEHKTGDTGDHYRGYRD